MTEFSGTESSASAVTSDVVIIGGGLVGMTLAIALARAGITSAVIDSSDPAAQTADGFDGRASAISTASWNLYTNLGMAGALEPRGCPIAAIAVTDGMKPGRIDFQPGPKDGSLGRMYANRDLRLVMYEIAAGESAITFLPNARVTTRERGDHGVAVTLEDGRTIRARLMVGAEGRQSPTRDEAGFTPARWDYGHRAIIAGLTHDKPHDNVAWEIFYPAGPFALLPLLDAPDADGVIRHRSALVWTVAERDAAAVLALPERAFLAEVEKRMGGIFGAIAIASPRSSYPLNFHHTARMVDQRLALVGDAAHLIHPIAGQGLNMGLKDVAALAECLVDAARLGVDPGARDVLERYQRWRRFDTVAMGFATNSLNALFSNRSTLLRSVRDIGLGLVDRLPPLKNAFIRQAAGLTGEVPRLLRGEAL